MRNCSAVLPLLMSILFNVKCTPVSQPAYENAQYVQAQNIPTVRYKPQQIQYKQPAQAARPVYEGRADGLQHYASQSNNPQSIQTPGTTPVRQLFVPTSQGPRPVDAAFYDQVLKAQQQAVLRRTQEPSNQQQVYQPQKQVKYVQAQPQYSAKYQQQRPQQHRLAPQQQQQQQQEEDEEPEGDYDHNPSYQFGFDVKDDQFTNYQTRKEERDGKKITGSYSVVDADGYIRTVKYTADPKEGFKAEVSREPTDIKIKIPKPVPQFQTLPRQHSQQHAQQQQHASRQNVQYVQVPQHRVPQRAPDEENVVYGYQ